MCVCESKPTEERPDILEWRIGKDDGFYANLWDLDNSGKVFIRHMQTHNKKIGSHIYKKAKKTDWI
jgi:hypothetical protein